MINVPVEVKDALREGSYKKNYRFQIQKEEDVMQVVEYLATMSATNPYYTIPNSIILYMHIDANVSSEIVTIDVIFPNNDIHTVEINHIHGKEDFYKFGECPANTQIDYSSHIGIVLPVGITSEDLIIFSKEWKNDFVIDNNSLVKESVSIDERMNSGDTLKFGLCEGSSLEFQYFGKKNIKGCRIQAFLDVYYPGSITPHTIPMGFFIVEKCSRQASTGIIKVTAYNKLMSDYLDAKANELIKNIPGSVHLINIEEWLLDDYGIRKEEKERLPQSATHSATYKYPITTAIKITQQYGIENPFNYYEMGSGYNYLWVYGVRPRFSLNPDYAYKLNFEKNFEYYERSVYAQMEEVFSNAMLNISASEIMDSFMQEHTAGGDTYHGFQEVIGFRLVKEDDSDEYYSTIGYENNCPGVVGTWEDLRKKTLVGYKRLEILLVREIAASTSSSSGDQSLMNVFYKMWGATGTGFHYYINAAHDVALSYYPTPIRYSDGSIIQYTDLENGNYFNLDRITNITNAEKIELIPSQLPDVTLRELQSADYELSCQYGQLDRETDLFTGVELNQAKLYPQESLYPDDALYPGGSQISANKAMYSKLWADEGNVHKWKYLIITYKGLDQQGNEVEKTLQRTVNADGTDNYNMSDNWLFRNLVWAEEDVETYADAMVAKMQDITWFPFEMWCAGLPYLETGDEIEIPLGEDTYTSYILQRQLKGIQNLQDTYINGTLDIF